MAAYVQNILAIQANTVSLGVLPVFASVVRAARELGLATAARANVLNKHIALRLLMLRRLSTYGNVALAGLWATLAPHDAAIRVPRATAPAVEPVRMTIEDNWRRATGVIAGALKSFDRIEACQTAAAHQLDAAEYALKQLIHDLRPAMALPADVTELRAVLAEAERTPAPVRRRPALAA